MKPVVVLGATGSIGTQALQAADQLGMPVSGLAARGSDHSLERLFFLAGRYQNAVIAVTEPSADSHEQLLRLGSRYRPGYEGVLDLAMTPGATVVNGIVGVDGLRASAAALLAGNRLALANKESLVAGGELITGAAQTEGAELIPVDSEHSALFQLLRGENLAEVEKLILTASGGPFRGMAADQLEEVAPQQALEHPTWQMGERITIDSATLVNKGLEVIEARHLFGVDYDRIEVVVHPESIVHSMVQFVDGSLKAHLGRPDMRLPIQYALTFPERAPSAARPFDPAASPLTFEPPDRGTFPALDLAFQAGREGGTAPAVFNAADEVAVEEFLSSRLKFTQIAEVIAETLEDHSRQELETVEQVMEVDRQARRRARQAARNR